MHGQSRVPAISRYAFFIFYLMNAVAAINVPPTVQKCCRIGEALNVSPMFCAQAPKQSTAAKFNFDAATGPRTPQCLGQVVIVEYNSKTTPMTLKNDGLFVPLNNSSVRIPAESFCLDNAFDDDGSTLSGEWAAWVCQPRSICEHMPCIQKCCEPGEHLKHVDGIPQCVAHTNRKAFVPTFHPVKTSSKPVEVFGVKHHKECLTHETEGDEYFLDSETGQVFTNDSGTRDYKDTYCIDNDDDGKHTVYFCYELSESWPLIFSLWISMVLVMITLVVYMIIPSKSTIVDRAHLCFVLCMFLSYAAGAIVTLLTQTQRWVCYMLSYFVFFTTLCYYTWLSVVIFEIYRFYRQKSSESSMTNLFRYYSIYAWGTAAAVTILGHNIEHDYGKFYVTDSLTTSCMYHKMNYGIYPVFVAIILLVLLVICGLIKWKIRQLTRETNQQKSDDLYRTQSIRYVRLVLAIISALVVLAILNSNSVQAYYVTQTLKIGPGVLVFIIFVLNWKTMTAIKKKCNQENDDPVDAI